MKIDIATKRGIFIGRTNSLLQEFPNVSKEVFLKLMNSSATTLYGSNLWNLFSKDCERLYTTYNVAIRNILKVDKRTHRFLIEPLSEAHHLKTMLMSKFISFHNALLSCSKFPVRFLARLLESDLRSVHGQNLNNIAVSCSLSWPSDLKKINSKLVKKTVCYRSIPEQESWKINICKELLYLRDNDDAVLPGFTADEQADLLGFLCAS